MSGTGYPRGRALAKHTRLRLIARLKAQGLSNRAVAQRVGVSENAVRKLLRRLGWRPASGTQEPLPLPPAPALAREVYGSLGPAFYGLRTTVVALLLMALLRIKRPEGLKEHAPDDLGRLLGLDRAPKVKTLPTLSASAERTCRCSCGTSSGS